MDQTEIDAFWRDTQIRGNLNPAAAYLGRTVDEALPPPAWSFGTDEREADELLALVLAGTKTATSSARHEYDEDGEDLPTPGMLSIVMDGAEHPRALIRTTAVQIARFDAVSAEHAEAEGEGDRSLKHWQRTHSDFFAGANGTVDPAMLVVLERFVVLASGPTRHHSQVRQDA
ncbi:MAG: ASCH domain-containing protein [Ornithinimicrobium sp.]